MPKPGRDVTAGSHLQASCRPAYSSALYLTAPAQRRAGSAGFTKSRGQWGLNRLLPWRPS